MKIEVVGSLNSNLFERKPMANSHESWPMIRKEILTSWRRRISCTAGRRCPPAARWGSLERCRRNKDLGKEEFGIYYLGGWYFLVLGVFGVRYIGVVSSNVSISVRLKSLFPFLLLLLKLLFLGGWSGDPRYYDGTYTFFCQARCWPFIFCSGSSLSELPKGARWKRTRKITICIFCQLLWKLIKDWQ